MFNLEKANQTTHPAHRSTTTMERLLKMDTGLIIFGIVVIYIVLNKWILPKLGVPT